MEPSGIQAILPGVLNILKKGGANRYQETTVAWERAVGEEQARHSEPYALRGKILFVRVDDSTRAFDLSRKYKRSLIKRMQNEIGRDRLEDIVFRVGQLSRSHRINNTTIGKNSSAGFDNHAKV